MRAVKFTTKVNNGKIEIPLQYQKEFNSDIKVILLKTEVKKTSDKIQKPKEAKGFGGLSYKANPDLWEEEESAWKKAVIDNYGDN